MIELHHNAIDLSGRVFSKLTVLSPTGESRSGKVLWNCLCSCGNYHVVASAELKRGKVKSCGCFSKGVPKPHMIDNEYRRLPDGESSFNALLGAYKAGALRRGHSWELSEERFRRLTKDNCHYCGAVPAQIRKNNTAVSEYIYNGIDRVDNNRGYFIENCVSCCKICNRAKDKMSREEFLAWAKRVDMLEVLNG